MTEIREILQKAEIFAALPAASLEQLAAVTHLRVARQGDLLFHQGDEAHVFYVVASGRLRLVQHTADGKDITMATFSPGDTIGVVMALSGDPFPGSAEALENVEVAVLPGDLMWQLMNEQAALAVRVLKMVAAYLHEAHDRIRELSAERVQQRIARSLLRLSLKVGVKEPDGSLRLDIRLSRQDLAQMNGTTLETVSRTLTAWERDGLVAAGREQITILKPHALVVIADDLPH